MPIVDSGKNRIISRLTEEDLKKKAEEIRFYSNLSAYISGTADSAGHNAVIDIASVLYFNYISHDPMNPFWDKRDRVFWSDSELAPVIYSTLALCGYFPVDELLRYKEILSGFDRYPDRFRVPGIEVSVDCRGGGLGVAVGDALSARMDESSYQIFCIMSKGEQSLGSVWEAADAASRYRLGNLTAFVGTGPSWEEESSASKPYSGMLSDRYSSFGWQVFTADSRDPEQIIRILEVDRKKEDLPAVIIADRYKEDEKYYYSGFPSSLSEEVFEENSVLKKLEGAGIPSEDIEEKNSASLKNKGNNSVYSGKYGWNSGDMMKTEFLSPDSVFVDFIKKAEQENGFVFYGRRSVISNLGKKYPGLNEIVNSGQNMILTASGLAKEGKIPFIISGGLFAAEKNFDQLRNIVCLNNFNVKFVDLYRNYSGSRNSCISQISDDISAVCSLNNLSVLFPSDSVETEKMIDTAAESYGPALIRIPCGLFPVVTEADTAYEAGCANVIRYRGVKENFIDAFEIFTGADYSDEKEDIALITFSRMVSEAMRSAYILKEEFGIEARVINAGSVAPLDADTVFNAASETKTVLVIGERCRDGFTDIIAASVMKRSVCNLNIIFGFPEKEDQADKSGPGIPAELSAEDITEKALELLNKLEIINEEN